MFVKRYVVLLSDEDEFPSILELPHETLQSAWEALKAQFERTVHTCFGENHKIRYVKGEAELVGDDGEYELRKESDNGPTFWVWDGDETTYKGVIREITIHCDQQEIERGYREQERRYLLEDAERHLYEKIGFVDDSEDEKALRAWNEVVYQRFHDDYGFSVEDAVCEGSEYFILDDMVALFERKRDCNLPENDVWEHVVSAVLGRIKAEREEHAQ